MSYYEYLRRLYIKELYLITFLSVPISIYLCTILQNHWLGTAILVGLIPTSIELYLLNRKKDIQSYKTLVLPRAIHFIGYYSIIMAVSLTYEPFRFEYLLFIPLGISATAFHPFFGKKLTNILFIFGLLSAVGLFLYEFSDENFILPLGIQDYIMVGYVFLLTAIFIYYAHVINERSKHQHKEDKAVLKKQLEELTKLTNERDELTFKLISDFSRTVADMDADFELIQKKSEGQEIRKMTRNGRKNALQLSRFIDDYTTGRKASYQAMMVRHVDLNELIVQELNTKYDTMQKQGINLSFEPYEGDLFYSDRQRIQTILHNLIQNAIEFADINKKDKGINIRVRAKQNAIELLVSDNGVGIEKENVPHIFKMFYSSKPSSTGSGLFAVAQAADAISAEINVKSQKAKGTVVKTTIPNMKHH